MLYLCTVNCLRVGSSEFIKKLYLWNLVKFPNEIIIYSKLKKKNGFPIMDSNQLGVSLGVINIVLLHIEHDKVACNHEHFLDKNRFKIRKVAAIIETKDKKWGDVKDLNSIFSLFTLTLRGYSLTHIQLKSPVCSEIWQIHLII